MAEGQRFRANVGIVVLNEKWHALALERIDKERLEKTGVKAGTGKWQMPQGGLDEGEEPEQAWQRELYEEIKVGKQDVELLGRYPEWLAYELPKEERDKASVKAKQGRGQVQAWYFVRLKPGTTLTLETPDPKNQEFVASKWLPLGQLAEEAWEVRRPIYLKLAVHLDAMRRRAVESRATSASLA